MEPLLRGLYDVDAMAMSCSMVLQTTESWQTDIGHCYTTAQSTDMTSHVGSTKALELQSTHLWSPDCCVV